MSKKDPSVDKLIDNLCNDLKPVKCLRHPMLRILPWVAFSVFYVLVIVLMGDSRPDMATKLTQPAFLFEMGLALALSFSAAAASAWLCVPDMRAQRWLLNTPAVLTGVFLYWIACDAMINGIEVRHVRVCQCLIEALILAGLPILALVWLARRGCTTRPIVMGLMNTASVSGLAWIGQRSTCSMDEISHTFIYHFSPFLLVAIIIALLARRLYRW